MAYAGKVIESPTTKLVFKQTAADTDGELLRFEQFVRGGASEVPEHIHGGQDERFVVLSGRMGVRTAGREQVLEAGEEIIVPAGTGHTFWNASRSGETLHHVVELRPALRHEAFFETIFGLQRDGKLPREGERRPPNLLQGALIVLEYENWLAWPSIPVQRAIFRPLALLGRLLGYRASYPRYGDGDPNSGS